METPIPHGTATGYQARKCRCQPCRQANTEAARKFRERRKALNPQPTPEERFWGRVEKTDTCWNWTGYMRAGGYGGVRIDGVLRSAHRLSYEVANGPIPEGMYLDHICHNTACVRPDHLRPVTTKQNGENRRGPASNNTSGILGVSWNKRARKWEGHVGHNGKSHHAGSFDYIGDAEAAVIALRLELFTHNDKDRRTA